MTMDWLWAVVVMDEILFHTAFPRSISVLLVFDASFELNALI